ncbi:MAG: recombinase family protein [Chloroflexota bacterium]|nr:recombinase family protein [Chloroflexota bacterium]MEE2620340.1 recombinase family protein [Chloroflexota bacterium]
MFFYGYIGKNSKNYDENILSKFLEYSLEHNLIIKKIFTEDEFYSDDIFEQCDLLSLLNREELKNSTLVIYNCLDLASNLISLSSIYISMKESNIEIQLIENNSSSILNDGLNRLGISKPKSQKYTKISETINLKSSRGAVLNRIPLGYEKSLDGKFKINEEEKLIVRKIFKMYSGNFGKTERFGLRKISENLKKDFKYSKYKWNPQSVKNILKNRFYSGIYQRDSKIISGNHDQIVTDEEFNFIQELFKKNIDSYQSISKKNKPKNYLNLICFYCNSKLNISYHSRKWKLSNGNKKKKVYYYAQCKNICKFKRKNIDISKYIEKEYGSENILLRDYKKRIQSLRKLIKLLILGRLSLKYFKKEIEILGKLEDLLNIKNIESFNLNNLNEKKSKILS